VSRSAMRPLVETASAGTAHDGATGRRTGSPPIAETLPEFLVLPLPFQHAPFHHTQLVVGENYAAFPILIPCSERLFERDFRAGAAVRRPALRSFLDNDHIRNDRSFSVYLIFCCI
jgi:hypothetical protein